MIYSVDTSALLHCWVRRYPIDSFPSLWENITQLINDGTLIASIEVHYELLKKEDGIANWVKQHNGMLIDTDTAVQEAVKEIFAKFPLLVNNLKDRTEADVFVIAVAKTKGCTVVTEEIRSNSPNRPKIPDVCDYFDIPK